ncbi:MAG: glycosyltransferase [Prevotella sp.]|nr:glycosyltransferase [Prevotella sp.]
MKVLILSTYEKAGGAAIAASRLMEALQKNGVEVKMLCRRNIKVPKLLHKLCPKLALKLEKQSWTSILERAVIWALNGFSTKDLWATDIALFGQDITKTKEYHEADVIHLHWINQGFLSLSQIRQFIKDGKKVVWTMHDAWNTMGAYHIAIQFRETFLERWTWRRKRALYSLNKIQFVTCSQWLMDEALSSPLMALLPIKTIPNPIDTSLFAPRQDKTYGRRVLFVAQNVNNLMKGMNYLDEAVKKLDGDEKVELIALGRDIPYIENMEDMVMLYNSVDVFVLPSLSENLPNTIMEAMACGTPCVGFKVGGIPEMIDHRVNGYVARYKDAADLADGIGYVMENRKMLGEAAREKVLATYSEEAVVKRYLEVYSEKIIV